MTAQIDGKVSHRVEVKRLLEVDAYMNPTLVPNGVSPLAEIFPFFFYPLFKRKPITLVIG